MENIHPEICPNCGAQLAPQVKTTKVLNEAEVKEIIFENEVLRKITEGVYRKENCPHYFNLLKSKEINASIVITCIENAFERLPLYEAALNKYPCKLSVIATHCIGVIIE